MFSFGETFMTLWAQIPTATTYEGLALMSRDIVDAYVEGGITLRDAITLQGAVEAIRVAWGIPEHGE